MFQDGLYILLREKIIFACFRIRLKNYKFNPLIPDYQPILLKKSFSLEIIYVNLWRGIFENYL
jgi:hypothetical protein